MTEKRIIPSDADLQQIAQDAFTQHLNKKCKKDSYKVGTFECDPADSIAKKGDDEDREREKKSIDSKKSFDEKTAQVAKNMVGRLSKQLESTTSRLDAAKAGKDTPRNKKLIKDLTKAQKDLTKQISKVQGITNKSGGATKDKSVTGDRTRAASRLETLVNRVSEIGKFEGNAGMKDALLKEANSVLKNPDATDKDYTNAINQLAERLGKKETVDNYFPGNAGMVDTMVKEAKEQSGEKSKVDDMISKAKNGKTFERVSEQTGKKATTTVTKDKDGSFKIGGTGFNGETVDSLVKGIKNEKDAETLAEMMVDGAQPGEMAAELEKPVFAVTHGKTEDGEPIAEVKLWRQDGVQGNFVMKQVDGKWQSTAKGEDKVFGKDLAAVTPLIEKAISETPEGEESHMYVGETIEGRFKDDTPTEESVKEEKIPTSKEKKAPSEEKTVVTGEGNTPVKMSDIKYEKRTTEPDRNGKTKDYKLRYFTAKDDEGNTLKVVGVPGTTRWNVYQVKSGDQIEGDDAVLMGPVAYVSGGKDAERNARDIASQILEKKDFEPGKTWKPREKSKDETFAETRQLSPKEERTVERDTKRILKNRDEASVRQYVADAAKKVKEFNNDELKTDKGSRSYHALLTDYNTARHILEGMEKKKKR